MQKLPTDLADGVYRPSEFNLYDNKSETQLTVVYGFDCISGNHNLRDKTVALDPLAAELARANADYWARAGVATIRRNDHRAVRLLALSHLEQNYSNFWRAVSDERRAMRPERHATPAPIVSIAELRAARECGAAAAAASCETAAGEGNAQQAVAR